MVEVSGRRPYYIPRMRENMLQACVLRPVGTKRTANGEEIDFERIYNELFAPALQNAGFSFIDGMNPFLWGNVRRNIFEDLLGADIVLCDVSLHEANVFYLLGVRQALRPRATVLARQNISGLSNFDFDTHRCVTYHAGKLSASRVQLEAVLKELQDMRTDSPVFRMLPNLTEANLTRSTLRY